MKFKQMVAFDPLWDRYTKKYVMEDVHCFKDIKNCGLNFDAVVSVDALNYEKYLNRTIEKIHKILKPSGCLIIHMNLRNKKQLNDYHRYYRKRNDVFELFQCNGKFEITRKEILKKDPINNKSYRTILLWAKKNS